MELRRPIQPGNTLRGYLHDLDRIRTELEDLGKPATDAELIACLVNGLKVPEYMAERNFLIHRPQRDFDVACALCRKTAIQDTIVAGVAASAAPAAFYISSPSVPVPSAVVRPSSTPAAPAVTPQVETTLNELQKTLALMATSLKGIDDKVSKLGSAGGSRHDQQGRGGDRRDNRDNRRPPSQPAGHNSGGAGQPPPAPRTAFDTST